MSIEKLQSKQCAPCNGNLTPLSMVEVKALADNLHSDWKVDESSTSLTRSFTFKGFAKAVYLSNACVWLADQEGHHPDIAFGWGYCHVTLTTHDISGLSENDFIWAAKLDALVSG